MDVCVNCSLILSEQDVLIDCSKIYTLYCLLPVTIISIRKGNAISCVLQFFPVWCITEKILNKHEKCAPTLRFLFGFGICLRFWS
jgi:hypothetical protein